MRKRSIVLCEGKTDQILLSYYFNKQFGYKYKGEDCNFSNNEKRMVSACIYERYSDKDQIVIWPVCGHSRIADSFGKILKINKINSDTMYSWIVIVADRDSEEENKRLLDAINANISETGMEGKIKEGQWTDYQQKVDFQSEFQLSVLVLIIPFEKNGALETFLLDALAEREENKYLVRQANDFVELLQKNREKLGNYLCSRRLCVKAPMAVFFAVADPDGSFDTKDTILLSVPWEKYATVQNRFQPLEVFASSAI